MLLESRLCAVTMSKEMLMKVNDAADFAASQTRIGQNGRKQDQEGMKQFSTVLHTAMTVS